MHTACRLPRYAKQLGLSGGGNFFGKDPYTEFTLGNGDRLRVFKPEVEDEELVWHRRRKQKGLGDGIGRLETSDGQRRTRHPS